MLDSTRKVPVVEDYASYAPPDWVKPTIERLLGSLSDGHINGLGAIVLSDAARATKRKMRTAGGTGMASSLADIITPGSRITSGLKSSSTLLSIAFLPHIMTFSSCATSR